MSTTAGPLASAWTFTLTICLALVSAIAPQESQEVSRVVAFGDSWTCCGGSGQPWVRVMADTLGVPLDNYAVFGATSGEILGQAQQYVNGGVDPDALHVYWNVGNDFTAPGGQNDIEATVALISANMTATIDLLRQAGAEHIVVMNNIDGALVPRAIANGLESYAQGISIIQNAATAAVVASAGPPTTMFDAETLFYQIVADPRFVNVTQGCSDVDCNNPDQFMWWDDNHPSAETHRIIAAAVLASGNYVPLEDDPAPDPDPDPDGAIQILSESFESGLDDWTQDAQQDWTTSAQRSVTGQRSAEVDGAANGASLLSPTLDLQGRNKATISFSWFIESRLDSGEFLAFDVSEDGASWTEHARLRGNEDPENTWHQVSVEVSGASDVRLRFRAQISSSFEDANVDDVVVVAEFGEPVDDPPVVELLAPTEGSIVGGEVTVAADATDDDDVAQVEFLIDGNPYFVDTTAPFELAWDTSAEADGNHFVTVIATDTAQQTASASAAVQVENVNVAPAIDSTPETSTVVGSSFTYAVSASDPDPDDVLAYTLTTAPVGMSIGSSGVIAWAPTAQQVGSHAVQVRVTDSGGLFAEQAFEISVAALPEEITLLAEDFEGGFGAGWSNSYQWFISTQRATSGIRSAEVDGWAFNSALTSPVIDMQGRSSATVSFSWLIENGFDSGEFVAVDVSIDGGGWVERARLRGNQDAENSWHQVDLDVAASATLRVRFRAWVSRSNEDANVDDIVVIAR